MHVLPFHLDIKGRSSCFCLSFNSRQQLLVWFLSAKPRNPCVWWFSVPFCRNNPNFFSFDVQFCIGLSFNFCLFVCFVGGFVRSFVWFCWCFCLFVCVYLLLVFFQMASACQVFQTTLSDEFVFNIYCFITLSDTGSFSPQEPSDLLHFRKCWDLVLIPEKEHEEKPHFWVTSFWDPPSFNSLATYSGLYMLPSLPYGSPAINRTVGSTVWPGHQPFAV